MASVAVLPYGCRELHNRVSRGGYQSGETPGADDVGQRHHRGWDKVMYGNQSTS